MTDAPLPDSAWAVQLVGPDELALNRDKPVHRPRGHQILARVEAVGLCFSDLKLLKQFSDHPRKGPVVSGIAPEALEELPSYVPGAAPTVPGHEVVCDILAVGPEVKQYAAGERVLVQADWRFLKTAGSNGAFGYDFEGGLQEYILFDERTVIDPGTGQHYLIHVGADLSASAVCLVEPWGCVENSYATEERRRLKPGGRLLLVLEPGRAPEGLADCVAEAGPPARVDLVASDADAALPQEFAAAAGSVRAGTGSLVKAVSALEAEAYDDIVYFGADPAVIEALNDRLAGGGIAALVLCGGRIGRPVSIGVGRIHYGMTRWVGTPGSGAAAAYATIPPTGELRDGDRVVVVGAGGPMGQMHALRCLSAGAKDLRVVCADIDDDRLAALAAKAEPVAAARGVPLEMVNTNTTPLEGEYTYVGLMAPVGALLADAITKAAPGCRINVFAGIPAPVRHELDMDRYVRAGCFMFGTSGSRIEDMEAVLGKVASGQLDTNRSVDAVSGMAGAIDGIRAVESRALAGKIIVYPELHELGLVPLAELPKTHPAVAAKLDGGVWTAEAEAALLAEAR
jgi:threonine dehydrogenase-like Zn-dependent dehydrogenase